MTGILVFQILGIFVLINVALVIQIAEIKTKDGTIMDIGVWVLLLIFSTYFFCIEKI